jgi:hypothetical protein
MDRERVLTALDERVVDIGALVIADDDNLI